MRKALGLIGLLVSLIVLSSAWEYHHFGTVRFVSMANIRNLLTWIGLFGILSLGQAIVIITGGIDLSVGSVVALVGISGAMMLNDGHGVSPFVMIPACIGIALVIGIWHGILVAWAKLQPFVVTLCGLFFYRGLARLLTGDKSVGFGMSYTGMRSLGNGYIGDWLPIPFVLLLVLAVMVGAFMHATPVGRHLFAIGANEEAARFSGLRTGWLKVGAYALCGAISAVGGLLLAFKINSMGPTDFGSFYELYAIAGAVLGGCSLRGGSGNVLGVVIGASLIVVLRNLVNILSIPSQLEYVVIGGAILFGVAIDEFFSRRTRGRVVTA